jgi:translation initiation factor 1
VTDRSNARLVYSTGGVSCPRCGWPLDDCKCSARDTASEALPARIVAKLRLEKGGRGGKSVTVVDGLPRNESFLKELCAELKRTCGTGGAVKDGTIELQGEHRERLRAYLGKKNYTVKG